MSSEAAYWMDLDKRGPAPGDDVLGVRFFMHPVERPVLSRGGPAVLVPRLVEMFLRHNITVRHQGEVVDLKNAKALLEREVLVEGKGRPVYEDVEYVEIRIPGDKDQINIRPVDSDIKRRFQARYDRWKAGHKETSIGHPLRLWAGISPSHVEDLAHFGVYTVEQLAETPDSALKDIGPISFLKQRAKDYLESAKTGAPAEALREELRQRDERMKAMEEQLKTLTALLAQQAKPTDAAPEVQIVRQPKKGVA